MTDTEALWYQALHTAWTTPDEVIDAVVRRATGSSTTDRSRIIAGEGNEVWSITTDIAKMVVRVNHRGDFLAEQWAAERSREAGVPTPEILLVDNAVDAGGKQVAIWVHRHVEGHRLDATDASGVLHEAGELLGRIHSVDTSGGPLDGRPASTHTLSRDDKAAEALLAGGATPSDIETATGIVQTHLESLPVPARLLHGDWLPEHVLVRDGRVAAVIDFGGTLAGDPAYDLAYWSFFAGTDEGPPDRMLDGYRRTDEPPDSLRLHLYSLGHAMRLIRYFHAERRTRWAHHCRDRFTQALRWLNANA